MLERSLRSIWQRGDVVVNGWLHIGSSFSAEIMAHAGWDSLTIDLQHGPLSFLDALPMLQAISTTPTIPLARVSWNDPGPIMKMLDAGCYGIICPMINSRAEAEQFVQACRYPPHGYRSYGPTRVSLAAGTSYAATANDVVATIAMIETTQALENLDDILQVSGLDAVYIGPADLGQSMGLRPQVDSDEPRLLEAIDTIIAAAQKHRVAAGIHTGSVAYAQRMIERGAQFVTVLSDARLMATAASAVTQALKAREPRSQQTNPY